MKSRRRWLRAKTHWGDLIPGGISGIRSPAENQPRFCQISILGRGIEAVLLTLQAFPTTFRGLVSTLTNLGHLRVKMVAALPFFAALRSTEEAKERLQEMSSRHPFCYQKALQ
jgi:hypothetical protein